MKVEIKDAKVELEVEKGKSFLRINGHSVEVPKDVGISLIFGDDSSIEKAAPKLLPPATSPPMQVKKRGCHTAASKKKLSASLKRFHANKRRKEKATMRQGPSIKKVQQPIKSLGKHLLNGAHVN